jgi:hypothetical protein
MSSIFKGDQVSLLKNLNKTAMNPVTNRFEFLDGILEEVCRNFNSSLGAIYNIDANNHLNPLRFYKIDPSINTDSLYHILNSGRDFLATQNITFESMGNSKFLCLLPMQTERYHGVLTLAFDNELDDNDIELLESVGTVLSSAIDRFYLQQQINQQYFSTVKSLVVAIEAKDEYTQGHSQRVADYSIIIGKHLKLDDDLIADLEITGLVHDVGKIGISDILLTKPDKLTEEEFNTVKQHPDIGGKILQPLNVSENVMLGTLLHHKRYDLKGYPRNLEIDKLPIVPAIIGVADAYDAMTSERSYKKTISKLDAIAELKRNRGTQFHPDVVDAVEELIFNSRL